MEVLISHGHRLNYYWQQTPFGHRWLSIMLGIGMLLMGLIAYSSWKNAQLKDVLIRLPVVISTVIEADKSANTKKPVLPKDWPTEEDADNISAEVLEHADLLGMVFERAEFQAAPDDHSKLLIQHIKIPLKGDYFQIRQFLSEMLKTYPSLALIQFKLQRSDVMQSEVEAYVEFSLYTLKREKT